MIHKASYDHYINSDYDFLYAHQINQKLDGHYAWYLSSSKVLAENNILMQVAYGNGDSKEYIQLFPGPLWSRYTTFDFSHLRSTLSEIKIFGSLSVRRDFDKPVIAIAQGSRSYINDPSQLITEHTNPVMKLPITLYYRVAGPIGHLP